VLCEKPIALSGTEAAELDRIAAEKSLILSEGFMYRHHEQTKRLLDLLDPSSDRSADLGRIRRIHGSFHITVASGPNVRTAADPGAGALYDVGCYLVDYCLALAGRAPREVFSTARFNSGGYDEFMATTLVFEDDCVAQLDFGFLGPRIDRMEVLCERGWIRIPHPFKPGPTETLTIHRRSSKDRPETVESIEIVDPTDPYLAEIRDFESAILENRAPLVCSAESVATASTLEAIRNDARSRATSFRPS
jgi:predicted dehydrogenase